MLKVQAIDHVELIAEIALQRSRPEINLVLPQSAFTNNQSSIINFQSGGRFRKKSKMRAEARIRLQYWKLDVEC